MPHLTYKVAIAMASTHYLLLHITYVDRLDDILKMIRLKSLKLLASVWMVESIRSCWDGSRRTR